MSLAVVHSRAQSGVSAPSVTVEVHLSGGLPGTSLPGTPLATVNLTTVARSPTTMTVTPNPVPIPAGQTVGHYTLTWNAPGFSGVELYARQNLGSYAGEIVCTGSGPASGTALEPISPGEVATLWMLPDTGCQGGTVVSTIPLGYWQQ